MLRDDFLRLFGGVYEASPWVAEAAWKDGAVDMFGGDLPVLLRDVVDNASRERQIELLRAHPDLAGRLALAGEVTQESRGEQSGAGLDQCMPDELTEFQALNDLYHERFGFPFILAVKGHTRATILDIFRRRVNNEPEAEFSEALEQVHRIAAFRLQAITERT